MILPWTPQFQAGIYTGTFVCASFGIILNNMAISMKLAFHPATGVVSGRSETPARALCFQQTRIISLGAEPVYSRLAHSNKTMFPLVLILDPRGNSAAVRTSRAKRNVRNIWNRGDPRGELSDIFTKQRDLRGEFMREHREDQQADGRAGRQSARPGGKRVGPGSSAPVFAFAG